MLLIRNTQIFPISINILYETMTEFSALSWFLCDYSSPNASQIRILISSAKQVV